MTSNMREVLEKLRKQQARRVHNPDLPGQPQWPHNACTLAALVRHELVTREETINARRFKVDVWTITDKGRDALKPKHRFRVAADEHVREGRRLIDYELVTTTNPAGDRITVRAPIAKIDTDTLDPRWDRAAAKRHAAAQDPVKAARRMARNLRNAA